jgi:hypothetical protein
MSSEQKPYGLAFGPAVPAEELDPGTIIVLDGHVLERAVDPDDLDRVRVVIAPALGPAPGRNPDHREIVVIAPRDMRVGTARPENIELAPLPERN